MGATENAGLESNGPKMQGWKMSEWRNANTKYKCVVQRERKSKNTYTQQQSNKTHNYEISVIVHTYEMHTNNFISEIYSINSESDMERVRYGIRMRRPKKRRNIQNEARIKCSIQRFDSVSTYNAILARHVPQPQLTHRRIPIAPDASDDDDDDIDAAPAEPAHASSSATSTSAAGEDVSTSTQPSVTNAACF